jgi:hypothetical protein
MHGNKYPVDNIHTRPAITQQIHRGLETTVLQVIITRFPLERLYKMRYIKFGADNTTSFTCSLLLICPFKLSNYEHKITHHVLGPRKPISSSHLCTFTCVYSFTVNIHRALLLYLCQSASTATA